jgi:hypothetical protein
VDKTEANSHCKSYALLTLYLRSVVAY